MVRHTFARYVRKRSRVLQVWEVMKKLILLRNYFCVRFANKYFPDHPNYRFMLQSTLERNRTNASYARKHLHADLISRLIWESILERNYTNIRYVNRATYSQSSNLRTHIKIHAREKPHDQCEACSKTFGQRRSFYRVISESILEKNYISVS